MGLLTGGFEQGDVVWTPQLAAALAWLGLRAVGRRHPVADVDDPRGRGGSRRHLFYLVPVTAIESWLLFDERLGVASVLGIGITGRCLSGAETTAPPPG